MKAKCHQQWVDLPGDLAQIGTEITAMPIAVVNGTKNPEGYRCPALTDAPVSGKVVKVTKKHNRGYWTCLVEFVGIDPLGVQPSYARCVF